MGCWLVLRAKDLSEYRQQPTTYNPPPTASKKENPAASGNGVLRGLGRRTARRTSSKRRPGRTVDADNGRFGLALRSRPLLPGPKRRLCRSQISCATALMDPPSPNSRQSFPPAAFKMKESRSSDVSICKNELVASEPIEENPLDLQLRLCRDSKDLLLTLCLSTRQCPQVLTAHEFSSANLSAECPGRG